MMKLLAFVDLHGSMKIIEKIAKTAKSEQVDFIISAGDHTIFGDSMKELIERLDKVGIPVLMTHGNHESEKVLDKTCRKTRNVRFMHKDILEIGEYVFLFYGGGGFSSRDSEFETWARQTMTGIKKNKKIILVTHAPPYDTKLDMIFDQPAGSKSIREFIKRFRPKVAISGHLHENSGIKDRLGKTKLINPGPWGAIIEV